MMTSLPVVRRSLLLLVLLMLPLVLAAPAHDGSQSADVPPGADRSPDALHLRSGRTWFSDELFLPRMCQPVLREGGESFEAIIDLAGTYSTSQVDARLVDVDGTVYPLTDTAVVEQALTSGSDLDVMLYSDGLSTLQVVTLSIPPGTPAGFYAFEIDIAGNAFWSQSAVRVYDAYPSRWGFIHISDTHVGYDEETYTATERLQFFVEEANFLHPELVIVTGDICEHQNAGTDWPQQFLGAVADLTVPVYIIPGNHDYYNDGMDHDPSGWMRYFHEMNRFQNSRLRFGDAVFYGLDTAFNYGLLEFYRCHGPSSEALDWLETDAAALDASQRPRFLLMHGPNFDYFSYNKTNTTQVRDMMNAYDFDLGFQGHTHRFETFLNSGTNYFGRNDFTAEDDWGSDVSFPGYPLHVQTSSLGKEEHLGLVAQQDPASEELFPEARMMIDAAAAYDAGAGRALGGRGIFGDDITWRWVQVDGTEVDFFSADTDGDGYRSTETPWPLGEIVFDVTSGPGGEITSTVTNNHHETWTDCRHYVPADPGVWYQVDGGTLVRRLPDGTAVVAVDAVGAQSSSIVTLYPTTGVHEGDAGILRLHLARPNPFGLETRIAFELPRACEARVEIYTVSGRRVATLLSGERAAGPHELTWDGTDDRGRDLASGVYLVRLTAGDRSAATRAVLTR